MGRPTLTENLILAIAVTTGCARHDSTAPVELGAPAAITVIAGDHQSALAGVILARPVKFQVADAAGNPIPATAVSLRVTAGEGSLEGNESLVVTDQSGIAAVLSWTLGKLAIPQQLTATIAGKSASATATISTQYHAELRFSGAPPDPLYLPAFTRAINRLNAEIVGQLSPVNFANQDVAGACGALGAQPLTEKVGSLLIYVTIDTIDGGGGIVASSGPCYVRQSNNLPVVGTMLFDRRALATVFENGQLDDVVLHEMHHVLGFGTLWATATPILIVNPETPRTAFMGASAIQACLRATRLEADCLPAIPLESGGGPGAADGHWRWTVFGNEMMTAFLPPVGTPKALSAITIASMSDLGYQTNQNVGDSYTISSSIAGSLQTVHSSRAFTAMAINDVIVTARFRVGPDGATTAAP